jgi:hypothetical protein
MIILFINVLSFCILTFFVFDAIRLFRWFVKYVSDNEIEWKETSLKQFGWKEGMSKQALKDLMLIQLIAGRTEAVGTLIYYPFIIWFIMFVARHHYFDNFHTPIGLAIVISMGAILAWTSAFTLRRSAERLRAQVIDRLERHLISVRSTELWEGKKSGQETSEYIQWVIDEIKAIRKGAFAPFLQQPALQSLLVPFASIGGANLLDLLK